MKKLLSILALTSVMFLFGCGGSHHKKEHKTKVHCYTTSYVDNSGNDMLLYWYLWYGSGNNCYYYSSPTPVTSFSNTNWSQSAGKPTELDKPEVKEEAEQELDQNELSPELQTEIEQSPEAEVSETASEDGGSETSTSSETSSESSSEGGTSDGGGGSDGGGDGGGGGD
jgi:uncharacterized membrane protein YgcG